MLKHKIIHSRTEPSKPFRFRVFFCAFFSLALAAGCTALPNTGPRPTAFEEKAQWEHKPEKTESETSTDGSNIASSDDLPFVLVDVTPKVVETLLSYGDTNYFRGAFTDRSPPTDVVLGVGDIVRLTIFEAGAGGLFIASNSSANGGNFITLPDQEVGQNGTISVPYGDKKGDGGIIKVQGRRIAEVQADIQERLMNKAIEPQVVVTIVKRNSNLFSVIGEVNSPGRYSIDQAGMRIMDALSIAGGPKNNDYNTLITLQRGSGSATARLSTVLSRMENNIFVQPNDLIAVKKDERFYNVLGATKINSRIPFEAENVTVADALAKAGGLDSQLSDPETVVVLRREELPILDAMSVKLDGKRGAEPMATVYRINLAEPAGMFLAQKMQLRHDDVVYVSTHPFNDISKIVGIIRDVLLIKLIRD